MLRTKKGFTLIELLVVIVIIGILVAIALPNFIKIKTKAREAEIKQNLHAIQLAIERYATDTEGQYPFFLYGGDVYFNIGTIKYFNDWVEVGFAGAKCPFDLFNATWNSEREHTYTHSSVTGGRLSQGTCGTRGYEYGDTLAYEGYMSSYPNNPFLTKKAINIHGEESLQWGDWIPWRGCGGRSGQSMFNIGWAGEGPSLMAYDIDGEADDVIKFEFPGQFYYHPRYSDGACNADHFTAQFNSVVIQNPGTNQVQGLGAVTRPDLVWSHDVAGYDLLGYGDPKTEGMDIDYAIPPRSWYKDYAKRTGYLNNVPEPNPYNTASSLREPRRTPDGIPDYYIIYLSSSQDAKPEGVI